MRHSNMKKILTKLTVLIPFFLSVMYMTPAEAVICPSIADVYIDQYAPDENMNYRTRILISYHPSKGIARGLFKFDIPEGIDAYEITAATLHLSGSYHTGGGDAIAVYCYALNAPFDEQTDTWNTLSGGDYDTSVASTGTIPAGSDWETSIDVTLLVNGNLEKLRDNGMLMRLQSEGPLSEYQNIASREYIDPQDFAPYLDIEYSENTSSSTTTEPIETSTTSMPLTSTTSSINSITTTSVIPVSSTTTIQPVTTTSVIPISSTTTIQPVTTTTVIEGTTTILTSSTTTGRPPLCPVETIYGEDAEETVILRYFRDHLLQSTPEGREIIQLYYQWSPFIVRMIENDLELRNELKETIDEFLHSIAND